MRGHKQRDRNRGVPLPRLPYGTSDSGRFEVQILGQWLARRVTAHGTPAGTRAAGVLLSKPRRRSPWHG
eukprot:753572-Hanusia_phi.AAC.1